MYQASQITCFCQDKGSYYLVKAPLPKADTSLSKPLWIPPDVGFQYDVVIGGKKLRIKPKD